MKRVTTLVAFCVLGGIFSEGIDLIGDRLIGSLIVGVGLPQINPLTEQRRDYFEEKSKKVTYTLMFTLDLIKSCKQSGA